MSEKPSEYLKRTCLICGCHTNQTINIYEPRSGPNIVELIQAKFKFQPLNEDKYLCFSCNNWLINWHSLQALNSNDAESPSGTFRSHMNNMAPEERSAGSQHASTVTASATACRVRPIAQVRPFQLIEADDAAPPAPPVAPLALKKAAKPRAFVIYAKRNYRLNHRLRPQRNQHRSLQTCCCLCGRAMAVRVQRASTLRSASTLAVKCRKCREVCAWRAMHVRSLAKIACGAAKSPPAQQQRRHLVNLQTKDVSEQGHTRQQERVHQEQRQRTLLKPPLVDGKVVAMLRRLGTTLSREQNGDSDEAATTKARPPMIMSPAKQRPRWTRPLADDEILLDFDTAISEVLPSVVERSSPQAPAFGSRRRLTYLHSVDTDGSAIDLSDSEWEEHEKEMEANAPRMNIYELLLPRPLSISLISN